MSALAVSTRYTPEDLLAMPDRDSFELVDGELVEKNVSLLSSLVGSELYFHLGQHVDASKIGALIAQEQGYRCYPDDPDRVRKPDIAFVRKGRFTEEDLSEGYVYIPPDLAIEVLSPNDNAYEVDKKTSEYLNAGVSLVWVINPDVRKATVHRPDRPAMGVNEDGFLDGEDVLPGFKCKLGELIDAALSRALGS